MTVAYDAVSKSGTGLTGATPNPMTWTHTPVGTPRGIIVFCYQESGIGSTITGPVTYGGVTMERCAFATQLSGGEGGAMDAYFLGDAIPTGAQTVSVTHNASGTDTRWCAAISVTAAADTELVAADTIIGNTETDPTFTFNTGSRSALRFLAAASGADAAGSIAGISGSTAVESLDTGSRGAYIVRADAAASGSSTVGATASSEDVAVVGLAVAEVDTNAVRHDKYTTGSAFTTTSPNTFSHTPKGSTPDGVLVWVYESDGTDTVTGVTYGGVAMTRVGHNDEPGYSEPGAVTLYHLGVGVPSGTQTVSIAHTGSSTTKQAVCQTLTAPGDTTVIVSGALSNSSVQDAALTLDASTSTGLMVFGGATGIEGRQVSSGEATLRGPSDDVGSKGWAYGRAAVNRTGSQSLELRLRASEEAVMFGAVVGFTEGPPTPGEPLEAIDPRVEIAFGDDPLAASPTWEDVSEFCEGFSLRRGRSSLVEDFEAGTGVIRLENYDGRFDPNNTSGEYYPGVTLRVPVRISIDHNNVDYVVFRGMVESWPIQYGAGGYTSWCNIPIVDLTKLLAGYDLEEFELTAGDSVGDRIGAVLDEVGWPAGQRDIDDGLASRPAVTFSGPAIQLIRDEARSDSGFFFIGADGTATYRGRTAYAGGNLINGTFGQADGEIAYERLTVSFDDDRLYNIAVVSQSSDYDEIGSVIAAGARIAAPSDTTSVANFGPYSLDIVSAWLNRPEALSAGRWAVRRYADQRVRIRSMTLFPQFDEDNTYPQVLGRDLRDGLVVKFQPPGGGTPLNQEVAVESISHDVTATTWVTTWELEPLSDIETGNFFTLGTSGSSLLGGDDVLA